MATKMRIGGRRQDGSKRRNGALRAALERLEERRLLTVTASLNGSRLDISSDSDADAIYITRDGTTLYVYEDWLTQRWSGSESGVNTIVVDAGGGADTVWIDTNVASRISTTINGGDGNDSLYGGDGADSINGGADDDSLQGRGGGDTLAGSGGSDVVNYTDKTAGLTISIDGTANDGSSGEGDNVGTDVETVIGGQGNDLISDGSGNEWLDGYLGNDTLVSGTGQDTLEGGDGTDTADYSARTSNLTITIDDSANDGESGEYDKVMTENVVGGSGDDTISGNSSANRLAGGDGYDWLYGYGGNDSLYGDGGYDYLYGGDDADELGDSGGGGILYGENGDDSLWGGDYGESFYGGAGADILCGNGGDDYLVGGTGSDTLYGGDGDDSFDVYNDGSVDYVYGEDGTDTALADPNDVLDSIERR